MTSILLIRVFVKKHLLREDSSHLDVLHHLRPHHEDESQCDATQVRRVEICRSSCSQQKKGKRPVVDDDDDDEDDDDADDGNDDEAAKLTTAVFFK